MALSRAALGTLAALVGVLAAGPGLAQDGRVGSLRISGAWIRATPNAAPTAAAYLSVTNRGAVPDRLKGGAARGVRQIAPHSMSMAGGVMRMRALPGGLVIPPHATVALAPGGDHLMLIGLTHGFRPGMRVPIRLIFSHAGPVTVDFPVLATAPASAGPTMKMP
jgi:copper(I)-binding protein